MSDRRPPACHHDRSLGHRVTKTHADDCPTNATHPKPCPGTDGCQPCLADHCTTCGRAHTDHDHPVTCPECISLVRKDLDDIRWFARHLRWQAARGDGLQTAGARIPGGDAMVVLARAGAGWDDLRTRFGPLKGNPKADLLADDHPADDVVPALLPLLGWEHQWRNHFGHQARRTDRSPVTAITRYLADQLTAAAQTTTGPDWPTFAADMLALRRELEGVLHDERDPQRGVPCFECGERLVRRYGDPQPCRHTTPARRRLQTQEQRAAAGRRYLTAVIGSYPELRGHEYPNGSSHLERAAARPPSSGEESAARVPCGRCIESTTGQGGIEDPSVGQSWECLGCRKRYTPGEYANAVRSDLLKGGPDGGWTHINMAAEAASTQTGLVFPASTVRKWMDRTKVASKCMWAPGSRSGLRMVFWPDVADQAAAAVQRQHELEVARRERAAQADRFYKALEARLPADAPVADQVELGKSMGIHPTRVRAFLDELEAAKVSAEAGQQAS